jgi:thioredoxin 2
MSNQVDVVRCPACNRGNRVPRAAAGTPRCGSCAAALPWVVPAGDDDFVEIAENARLPVVLDLWAPWCGPCRMLAPVLERLAADEAGRVKVVKVNVDTAPRIAVRYGASSIPTLLVLNRGREVARQVGALPEPLLRRWITEQLAGLTPNRPAQD